MQRRPSLLITAVLLAGSAWACGKKSDEPKGAAAPGSASASAAAPPVSVDAAPAAVPAASCAETNQVTLSFAEGETSPVPAAGFQLTSTIAFTKADAAGTGKKTSVVYGNYGLRDTFGPSSTVSYNEPAKAGELAVELTLATPQPVAAGEYPAGMNTPGAFMVTVFAGGESSAPTFAAKGKATITVASGTQLCGTFEATDDAGSSVKGSFSAPLADHAPSRGP